MKQRCTNNSIIVPILYMNLFKNIDLNPFQTLLNFSNLISNLIHIDLMNPNLFQTHLFIYFYFA